MKKTYEEYKKENIELMFNGKKYVLIEDAEISGTYEHTIYVARAVDEDLNEFHVTWELTEEQEQRLEENPYYEDESEACDWENPITVERV